MVQKVRGLSVKVMKWAEKARKIFDSGEKLSMQDAKALLEAGEKLQVNTAELRTLKAAHRAARSWANRVKRCNLDQGEIHVNTVKELIKEQKSLLIEMPEEFDRLQNATQSYCICRRPYDGFMIGCDECEEWYHGPCIGVSESKAGRFETYQCMRCSVKNVFKSSASSAAGIIRKWTSRKDLKKARQVEYQKVQRKVRKETKDAEKFRKEIVALEAKLSGEKPAMEEPVDAKTVQSSDVVSANTPSLGEANESADEPKVETEENEQTKDESTETGSEIAAEAEAKVENMKVEGTIQFIFIEQSKGSFSHNALVCCEADVEAKLEKAMTNLKQAEERLVDLAGKSADLKRIEQYENKYAEALRRWCIRVRSLVLVPSLEKQAEEARPLFKGALSQPMLSVMADASVLGISDMPDVDDMLNAFECMSWSMYTLSVIKRKPNFAEMNSIVEQGSTLTLPDEKALRTMKHMQQRALQWQGKIRKSLLPKPGSTKALSMDMLKELLSSVEDISVHIPEVNRLKVIIEDKGARHCVCGGPSDGQFMLCCDKCERWFHGSCMNLTKESSDDLKNWLCAPCAGNEQVPAPVPDESGTWNDCSGFSTAAESTEEHDVSLHAPEPSKLWPPFALLGSEKATESLGAGCAAIPDEMHSIRRPTEDNGPSKAVNENPEVRKENGAEILLPDAVSGKSSAGSNLAPPMNSMATRTSTRTSSSTCLSVKDNESTEQSKPFDVQPPSVVSNDSLVPSTTPQPAEEVVTLEASSTNRNLAEQAKVVTSTDPACKLISNECPPMEVDDSGEKSQRAPEFVTGQYQSQNKETPVVKSQEPHRVVDPKSASDNVCGPMEMDDSNEATSALDASESHSVVDGILSSKPSESEDRMVEEECSKNKTAEEECIKDKMVEEECSKDKAIEEECSKDKMVEEECNGAESGLMSGSSSTQGCEPYLNQKVTVTPSASDVKFSDIEQEAPLNTRDNRDTDSPMCHSTEIKENLPNTQALAQVLQEARV